MRKLERLKLLTLVEDLPKDFRMTTPAPGKRELWLGRVVVATVEKEKEGIPGCTETGLSLKTRTRI